MSAASHAPHLEIAHVLFMDVVGYSKLPVDQQQAVLSRLQAAVCSTPSFARSRDSDRLIRLPTGDGMALVFFEDPEEPVRCAVELAHALRSARDVQLRMGVHSGPVYRVADINANRNVAGGGINLAQRVMDCGDAGHILLSSAVAEVLSQISAWKPYLNDLGEAEVKHGVRVHLFNLFTGDVGNRAMPHAVQNRGRNVRRVALAMLLLSLLGVTVWRARVPKPTPPSLPAVSSPSAPKEAKQAPVVAAKPSRTAAVANPASRADKIATVVPVAALSGRYVGEMSNAQATLMLKEERGVVTGCLQIQLGGGPIQGIASGMQIVATVSGRSSRTELQGQISGEQFRGSYSIGNRRGSFVLKRENAGVAEFEPCAQT